MMHCFHLPEPAAEPHVADVSKVGLVFRTESIRIYVWEVCNDLFSKVVYLYRYVYYVYEW